MLITNLPDLKNVNYEILGIADGTCVYAKNVGKDIMASFKNFVGGELKSYTEMIDDAKRVAINRLEENVEQLNADAVLNITYSVTNLQSGSALVVTVVGTCIKYL